MLDLKPGSYTHDLFHFFHLKLVTSLRKGRCLGCLQAPAPIPFKVATKQLARILCQMPYLRHPSAAGQPPSPDTIQAGLPAETYLRLRDALMVTDQQLAHYLRIPMRTLQRRLAKDRFSVAESDRLARLERLFKAAESALGDAASAQEWMLTPNPSLNFKAPLELTATDPGSVEVERLLMRIEYGVF